VRPVAGQFGSDVAALVQRDPLFRDAVVYLTCVHEIGHALGLMHTTDFDDIMYWFGYGGDILGYFRRYRDKLKSRSDIPQHSGLSANDVRYLRELYPLAL
jgi:predicted Zn-dependent protease